MRRIIQIKNHLTSNNQKTDKNTITITDNRTGISSFNIGKTYTLSVKDNYVKASDIEKIKSADGKPLRSYDPAYMNTICCVNYVFI
jgi:citrate synthase